MLVGYLSPVWTHVKGGMERFERTETLGRVDKHGEGWSNMKGAVHTWEGLSHTICSHKHKFENW